MNPYESPTTQPHSRLSFRRLWQQELICPHCQKVGSSAGRACLLHPQFRIRCYHCRAYSRLKFERRDWLKIQGVWILAVGFAVAVLMAFVSVDPFLLLTDTFKRLFPEFHAWVMARGYDSQQTLCFGVIILLSTLVPIILASLFAVRVNLWLIAFRSQMVPAATPRSKENNAPANGDRVSQ